MPTLFNNRRVLYLPRREVWNSTGYKYVLLPFIRGVVIGLVFIAAGMIVNKNVEAGQLAESNRVAAVLANQATYIKSLELIVDRCTSPGENVITVDGVYYLCGAANTGIKVRP